MEMKFKIQNSKFKIASKRGRRLLADYAEREQLKALEEGLKFKIADKRGRRLLADYAEREQLKALEEGLKFNIDTRPL